MSIRRTFAHQVDQLLLRALGENSRRISITPVFHVEQLFNDTYYQNLLSFLKGYRALTSKRAVVTCMTPISPILAFQMKQANFDEDHYWERIASVGEDGIVGLHGHFLRAPVQSSDPISIRPMHWAYHDMSVIEEQLVQELHELRDRRLVEEDLLIYSAGWWFTTPQLRSLLVQLGFQWDYSLSSSPFNRSPGSQLIETRVADDGLRSQTIGEREIHSATAVCSIASPGRPYKSISKLIGEARRQGGPQAVLSLYAHDFDLNTNAALQMTERYCQAGFGFLEPGPQ